MSAASGTRAVLAGQDAWWTKTKAIRAAAGEPVGWAATHGSTGHCITGRHNRCPYRPDGALWPEITLERGDTYACPCRCHLYQHQELP